MLDSLASPRDDDDDDFDWIGRDEDVVLRQQPETAVFVNHEGCVVVRQRNWPNDDQAIIITGRNLPLLIARLQAALTEVAEFERWEAEHPEEAAEERRQRARELRHDDDEEDDPSEDTIADLRSCSAPRTQDLFGGTDEPDDEWREPIANYLADMSRTTIADVAEALHLAEPGTADQRRIVTILTALGWTPRRDKRGRWWERGDGTHIDDGTIKPGDDIDVGTDDSTHNTGKALAACRTSDAVKRSPPRT